MTATKNVEICGLVILIWHVHDMTPIHTALEMNVLHIYVVMLCGTEACSYPSKCLFCASLGLHLTPPCPPVTFVILSSMFNSGRSSVTCPQLNLRHYFTFVANFYYSLICLPQSQLRL